MAEDPRKEAAVRAVVEAYDSMRDVFAELGLPPPDDVRLRPGGEGVTEILIHRPSPPATAAQRLLLDVRAALHVPNGFDRPEMSKLAEWLGVVEPENLARIVKRVLGAAGYALLSAELRARIDEISRQQEGGVPA